VILLALKYLRHSPSPFAARRGTRTATGSWAHIKERPVRADSHEGRLPAI
jgi:hypothetical protein